MATFVVDQGYKGPKTMTFSVYLMNRAGLLKIFKPKSKVYVTVDLDKHVVLIHDDYSISNGVRETFGFSEISHVTPDLSCQAKNRYYT